MELPIAVACALIVNHKPMAHSSIAERAFYFFGLALARLIYHVQVTGREHLPAGGFLLLPNHITWVDAIVLQLATPRPIRFIIFDEYYRNRFLHPFLRLVGCIPINPKRAKEAIRDAAERIRAGEIVCLFPEGHLTRTGTLLKLQRGYELIARQADALVVPVWMDELWGSIFSYQGGRYFTKWPREIPYGVRVLFGEPIAAKDATIALVREQLLKLGERCYSERKALKGHLAEACVRGLKRKVFGTAVVDGTDGSILSRGKLLGVAIALSRRLRKQCAEKRVAVALPAGKGGVVAHLAILLAGKTPVGLNFTAGRAAIEYATKHADICTTISATPFRARVQDFPWTQNALMLDEALPEMKRAILFWWIASVCLPAPVLLRILGIPTHGGHEEAVLLFTSGSSGEPKGVVLSHHNIIGNVSQFSVMLDATSEDMIVASLPFFHSFGATVTLWYPMINGVPIVTYPSPLEASKIADLVEKHRATVMLATPTFLRAYLRKAEPQQFRTLRLVITGAEKLPLDLAKSFQERFGMGIYEGYGLTETSPVVSVNLPVPKPKKPGDVVQPSARMGSVGKMAAGIAAEIRDAETGERLSLHDSGMLWLRGPNIFKGYLNQPERTAEVIQDGWFKTGDIGRFDEDGFLYIEGRLSRFSKIGGEMVPHELIEQKILNALNLDGHAERVFAIVGIPDEAKGEALVLLSSIEIDLPKLRKDLAATEIPNLWIPRVVKPVEAIPVLGSGKLDLAKCRELALA
jgi:acyl-[acyl-carrier-protein]-phospholipid O-acyltransferase/long-chain-fatty-acid--[acyl-carrier-protein] ligase